ncbi:MAG: HAMP domain-containing sensor histidine kinase, partial [Pseudomonadota bacterium]
ILVSAPIILVIASGFGQFQLMILMLNFVVLSVLLRWYVAIFMIASYAFLGAEFYSFFVGEPIGDISSIGIQFKMMYLLLMFSSVLIGFLKPQQDHEEFLGEKIDYMEEKIVYQKAELVRAMDSKNEFLRNIEHESRTPITGVTSMIEVLEYGYDKFSDEQRKEAIHEIAKSSERFNSWASNLVNLSKFATLNYLLDLEPVNIGALMRERLSICQKVYIEDKDLGKRSFVLNIDENAVLTCDSHYIGMAIDSVIINAIQYCKKGKIELNLYKTAKEIELSIKDEGIGIPKSELYDIFGVFTTSSRTKSVASGRGVGLTLAKQIIEAHNGTIVAESDGPKGAVFRIKLPIKL